MWIYEQATGRILLDNGDSVAVIGVGYSGHDEGKNNPVMETVHGVGPIPCGLYSIGDPHDNPDVGKFAMELTPLPETNTFGRTGFFWHGDSEEHLGAASHGCIVSSPLIRHRVAAGLSTNNVVKVISGLKEYGP